MAADPESEEFRELLIRWFQWSCFCPVMRLHGDRLNPEESQGALPIKRPLKMACCPAAAPTKYGAMGSLRGILERYLHLREKLRPITREAMRQAHEKGTPVMRPLFYEFPDDPQAWEVDDTYLFGSRLLVAPILELGARTRNCICQKAHCGSRCIPGNVSKAASGLKHRPPWTKFPSFCGTRRTPSENLV